MSPEFVNWSGSLRFTPAETRTPQDELELSQIVEQARDRGLKVRVVGAGHSSSPLVRTTDVLVSLTRMQGVVRADPAAQEAWIRAGTTVGDAAAGVHAHGLAVHNTGDVDVQLLAGAIATGTHGTGRKLQNLATMLIGGTLVTADGTVREVSIEREPELFHGLRCSLGALGIFTELRVKLLPAYRLRRREWCATTDETMARFDEVADAHRNFDMYWYPRRDDVKLRTWDVVGEPAPEIPFSDPIEDREGWAHETLPKKRKLKFEEMEYALPAEAAPACFAEVRKRIKAVHRRTVAWRVLYRTVAADDAWLSTAHGRPTVNISLHHNAGLDFWPFFGDLEPVFRDHGGRPHWGKKHRLAAADLRPLYPGWDDFQALRRRMDPDGVFLADDLRQLLEGP
jgi:FAD/FMN-containing dehydrogenase